MKVGIIVDDYKLPKFERSLKSKGFVFTQKPFTEGTTAFFLIIQESQVEDVYRLCKECEIDIKQSN